MKTDQSPGTDAPTTSENQPGADPAQDSKAQTAKKGKGKKPPPDPKEVALDLLRNSGGKICLNAGQHFDGERLWYGIPTHSGIIVVVNSKKKIFPADKMPLGYEVNNSGLDRCSFSEEGILEYLDGSFRVNGFELLSELISYFKDYVIFEDERQYTQLSLWAIGTYCYTIFRVFPYLSLRSATKECGKSRTLDLLNLVCFNADTRTASPTEATLFRGTFRHGGTLLLDEMEGLTSDKDRMSNIISVLNSGFEQGGTVPRMEKRGNNWIPVEHSTYSPKAIAGINKLADTLDGRCITLYLIRKRRDATVKRFSPVKLRNELQPLRDKISVWCLANAPSIARIYLEEVSHNKSLDCLGDRDRDLWEPLISIAMAIEEEASVDTDFVDKMVALAGAMSQVKYAAEDENVARLINRLETIMGENPFLEMTPTELWEAFKAHGHILKSTKALAGLLSPIGITAVPTWRPDEKKTERVYTIYREGINDLKARYLRPDSPAIPPEKA
ncbi:MAG: DUF3631 domain-containing protein [Desulfarculaceae bacterium]|nr:DUF3631 domain-containing protein [Desulfarculaceae bacterium]